MPWYSLWSENTRSPLPQPTQSSDQVPPQLKQNAHSQISSRVTDHEPLPYSTPPRPLTRDELAEQEFTEAFEELKRDAARYEAGETRAVDAPPRISDFLPPANIHPSNLPIKRLRCRDRFDYAFACQGFGGQFLHNYRYASLPRDCSEVWSEFWFCMRNKARSEEIQERMYRERRVQKDEERYGVGKRSSEDVWAMRMMPVKGSFDGDYEADLAAWREQDEEGKKRIAVM